MGPEEMYNEFPEGSAVRAGRRRIVLGVWLLLVSASCLGVALWERAILEPPKPLIEFRTPTGQRREPVRYQGTKIKAMTLVGAGPISETDLQPLKALGVNTLVLIPWGEQVGHAHQIVKLRNHEPGMIWGDSDEGLRETARIARAMGFKIALKPHVKLIDARKDNWSGHIRMKNEADWNAWFASYTAWILHYADLAQEVGAETFCVGTELDGVTRDQTERMRVMISAVRERFPPPGKLTFSANWNVEFARIRFWDALDYIGVNSYFPLAVGEMLPAKEGPRSTYRLSGMDLEVARAWTVPEKKVWRVAVQYQKPVLFTEMGYRSSTDALSHPHLWPQATGGEPDEVTQAMGYHGFFTTFFYHEWVAGAWVWEWFPNAGRGRLYPTTDFSPQGKAAEKVLARWYRQGDR